MNQKMTTYPDAYRELEIYLEKAKEDIGKALDELLQHENDLLLSTCDLNGAVLSPSEEVVLPPAAFRTAPSGHLCSNNNEKNDCRSMKQMCYEPNVLDSRNNGSLISGDSPLRGLHSCSIHECCCTEDETPTTKVGDNYPYDNEKVHFIPVNKKPNAFEDLRLNTQNGEKKHNDNKRRSSIRRSLCETLPTAMGDSERESLYIWLEDLTLDIEASLTKELDSGISSGCLSDFIFDTNKYENEIKSCTAITGHKSCSGKTHCYICHDNYSSYANNRRNSATPTLNNDTHKIYGSKSEIDDALNGQSGKRGKTRNYQLKSSHTLQLDISDLQNNSDFNITNCITPPPPEFEDDNSELLFQCLLNKPRAMFRSTPAFKRKNKIDGLPKMTTSVLKVANTNIDITETEILELNYHTKDIHSEKRRLPSTLVDISKHAIISTKPCVINGESCQGFTYKKRDIIEDVNNEIPNVPMSDFKICRKNGNTILPKLGTLSLSAKRTNGTGKYSSSLPKDSWRAPTSGRTDHLKRSSSSSAVASITPVSDKELAVFMCKVKKSTYQPPPLAYDGKDVPEDFKMEDLNRDAVTQTPFHTLSRSSSFTWVSECDCHDWDSLNVQSDSEDSLFNSDSEKKNLSNACCDSSSSSFSTDDINTCNAPENSDCSSLYLSAYSETVSSQTSNSSLEDTNCLTDVKNTCNRDKITAKSENNVSAFSPVVVRSFSVEKAQCVSTDGTLADRIENDTGNETFSIRSSIDRLDKSYFEEPTFFRSTVEPRKKTKFGEYSTYPSRPIETQEFIIDQLNVKSKSIPMLRQKKRPAEEIEKIPLSSQIEDRVSSCLEFNFLRKGTRELCELQAIEACSWLRAAGFPQYAQMYEDKVFPIDISIAQKDHAFLHPDSIQSLVRRLNTLNRCARMKSADNTECKSMPLDDSDEEEQCALSEHWQFQRISRRWSRVPSPTPSGNAFNAYSHDQSSPKPIRITSFRKYLSPEEAYSSSHDSVLLDEQRSSPDSIRRSATRSEERFLPVISLREGGNSPGSSSGSGGALSLASEDALEKKLDITNPNLHRSGSDRIKERAKALLRRMESLKGRRKKKLQADNERDASLSAASAESEENPCTSLIASPFLSRKSLMPSMYQRNHSQSYEESRYASQKDSNTSLNAEMDNSVHSDSECSMFLLPKPEKCDFSNETRAKRYMTTDSAIKQPNDFDKDKPIQQTSKTSQRNFHAISSPKKSHFDIHGGDTHRENAGYNSRASRYDNLPAPLAVFNSAYADCLDRDFNQSGASIDSSVPLSEQESPDSNEGEIIIINTERRDSGVGASLTRGSSQCYSPWHCFLNQNFPSKSKVEVIPITNLSSMQLLVLRKLSLLKLTTLMEKFSPSSRTGWSWGVPKFIRRIRTPDYKDKVIFGVPLILSLQRTGQAVPSAIMSAIQHLRKNALNSVGLFRKSGVRSRIQTLRNMAESDPDTINYDDQHSYDVADMIKQYFRELPEALLTNKLSETFIGIFQYIPQELRLDAIHAAILLMPEENREVLQALISFLQEVCKLSDENQMTATNLAVCFAPSLFQLSSQSTNASPRRRKTVGAPDVRELNENKAAYECLSYMIVNYEQLSSVSENIFSQKRLSYMDDCEPANFDHLSRLVSNGISGWKMYIDGCVQSLLKETKDKYKGWISVAQMDSVDISYKKVDDGHPLRLWKVSTEVEAPPTEVLSCILRERHIWDSSFVKWRIIQTLEKQSEIYQYVIDCSPPHPFCDYCVIRSWKTDLPKGSCILIEASVDHPDANVLSDGIRAFILSSRYLIEPSGSGKSRIIHISRVDTKGRSPEWYNKIYGHICSLNIIKLRNSFSHVRTEGPETKV